MDSKVPLSWIEDYMDGLKKQYAEWEANPMAYGSTGTQLRLAISTCGDLLAVLRKQVQEATEALPKCAEG